jgi:hypothetical protein
MKKLATVFLLSAMLLGGFFSVHKLDKLADPGKGPIGGTSVDLDELADPGKGPIGGTSTQS